MADDLFSLQKMQVASWVVLLVITAGAWIVMSWSFAWSVFAGGVISIFSFIVSSKDVVAFFESLSFVKEGEEESKEKVKKKKKSFILRFWFRILIIGIALLILIKSGKVNVFGLILGLSTVVISVTFIALNVVRRYFFSGRR